MKTSPQQVQTTLQIPLSNHLTLPLVQLLPILNQLLVLLLLLLNQLLITLNQMILFQGPNIPPVRLMLPQKEERSFSQHHLNLLPLTDLLFGFLVLHLLPNPVSTMDREGSEADRAGLHQQVKPTHPTPTEIALPLPQTSLI